MKTFKILAPALFAGCFYTAAAQEGIPGVWAMPDLGFDYGHQHLNVPVPGAPAKPRGAAPSQPMRMAGSARVEVWGDMDPVERLRVFRLELAPFLARSFQLGQSSTTNRQQLGEFMTMTAADVRPPSVPLVYYNAYRPVEDPDLARTGIHVGITGNATVTISAQPRR